MIRTMFLVLACSALLARPAMTSEPTTPESVMIRDVKNHLRKVSGGLPTNFPATAAPFRWLQNSNFKEPVNRRRLEIMWRAVKSGTLKLPSLASQKAGYAEQVRQAEEQVRKDSEPSWWSSVFEQKQTPLTGASIPAPPLIRVPEPQAAYVPATRSPYAPSPPAYNNTWRPATWAPVAPHPDASDYIGYGEISEITGQPRTILVTGYKTDSGKIVRPHARSR